MPPSRPAHPHCTHIHTFSTCTSLLIRSYHLWPLLSVSFKKQGDIMTKQYPRQVWCHTYSLQEVHVVAFHLNPRVRVKQEMKDWPCTGLVCTSVLCRPLRRASWWPVPEPFDVDSSWVFPTNRRKCGFPWWSSGQDSALPMQGSWVWSFVRPQLRPGIKTTTTTNQRKWVDPVCTQGRQPAMVHWRHWTEKIWQLSTLTQGSLVHSHTPRWPSYSAFMSHEHESPEGFSVHVMFSWKGVCFPSFYVPVYLTYMQSTTWETLG